MPVTIRIHRNQFSFEPTQLHHPNTARVNAPSHPRIAGLEVPPALLWKEAETTEKAKSRKTHGTPKQGEAKRDETRKRGETKRNETEKNGAKRNESPTTPCVSRACLGSRLAWECFVPARSPSLGSTWCSAIAHRRSVQEYGDRSNGETAEG